MFNKPAIHTRRWRSRWLAGCALMLTVASAMPAGAAASEPAASVSGQAVTAVAGGQPVPVDPGVTLAGFDSVSGATVAITGGFVPGEDRLLFTGQNGIMGAYSAATGILRLSGTATGANYEAALRSVRFQDTNPVTPNTQPRTVTFTMAGSAVYQPATQHYYEFVEAPGISWTAARDAAAGRSLSSLQGYLVTITSAQESAFVTSTLPGSVWMGASDAAQEGEWRWVAGPEAGTLFSYESKSGYCFAATAPGVDGQYANWALNQPDDCGGYPAAGYENYGFVLPNGGWNDLPDGSTQAAGYVVEYGGMQGDIQPALSAGATVNVIPDTVPPTIRAIRTPANQNGWNSGPVAVQFECADADSGIASCTSAVALVTEGAAQKVVGTAKDRAGNVAEAAAVAINIDRTPPVTSMIGPGTWQDGSGTITLAPSDSLSGTLATHYRLDYGAVQAGTSLTVGAGTSHTLQFWSTDKAGNTEAAHTVTILANTALPVIHGSPDRTLNAAGWYNADVTVSFTCSSEAGIASCTPPVTLTGEGGNQSVTGYAVDNAGNTAGASVGPINVDKTAPTVAYAGNEGTYLPTQEVAIRCTAADELSGVASTTCADIVGPAYSFGPGLSSFGADATDQAGNTGTGSVAFSVTVTYDSLCSLVTEWAGEGGIARSLCAKLSSAAASEARGDLSSKTGELGAFVHEVDARTGKSFLPEQAGVLKRLAMEL